MQTHYFLGEAKALLPELPSDKRARFVADYALSTYDAAVLADDLALAAFFEEAAKAGAAAKRKPKTSQIGFSTTSQQRSPRRRSRSGNCPISPDALDELVNLIDSGKISGKQGKEVFAEMFASGKAAGVIVEEKGLEQVSDTGALEQFCDQAIAAQPKAVAEYRAATPARSTPSRAR